MEKPINLRKVYGAMLFAIVIGSTVSPTIGVLIKMGVSATAIAFYRLFFISIFMVPLVFSKKKHRDTLKNANKGTWICILGYTACQTMGLLLWTEAINAGATAFLVNIMGNLSVVFVVIFSYIFLHEKTSKRALCGVGICLSGVFIVGIANIGQGLGGATPIIISVIASIGGAAYNIFGRGARKNIDLLPLITFGYACSCILTGTIGLLRGASFVIDIKSGALLCFLGCFSTIISHSTPIWALKYLRPASVSVLNLMSPFITAILGYFVLNEVPTWATVGGAIIMVVGVWYYVTIEQREAILAKAGL